MLNYGTIAGAFHMDCPGNLLNFGELHISQAQFLQTNLWNPGRFGPGGRGGGILPAPAQRNRRQLWNGHRRQQAVLTLECPGTFFNGGSVEVGRRYVGKPHPSAVWRFLWTFPRPAVFLITAAFWRWSALPASWDMHPDKRMARRWGGGCRRHKPHHFGPMGRMKAIW